MNLRFQTGVITMIKLIASDLDGTLLQNGAQTLDPQIFNLIRNLRKYGILFVAASGRQYVNLRRLFHPVQDEIAYIAENGSLCIMNGQTLSKGTIDRDLGLRIIEAIHQFGGCHCLVSGERVCYTDSSSRHFIDHMIHVVGNDMEVVPDLSRIPEPFLKISVCDFHGTKNCFSYFQEQFSQEIKAVTSGNIWVDFIAPGANKGTALQSLFDHLKIAPHECVAFGDQYNDIEMLQLAGTSYAMANSAPGISFYTTGVTDSVTDVLQNILRTIQMPEDKKSRGPQS